MKFEKIDNIDFEKLMSGEMDMSILDDKPETPEAEEIHTDETHTEETTDSDSEDSKETNE